MEPVGTTQDWADDDDFWNQVKDNAPDETPAFSELPPDVFFLCRTATNEDGKAGPKIRTQEKKEGGEVVKTWMKFAVGLIVEGGQPSVVRKVDGQKTTIDLSKIGKGKYLFTDLFVHPNEKDGNVSPLSGPLAGFFNCLFSPGVGADAKDAKERGAARWKNTVGLLRREAKERGISPKDYNGDMALTIAGTAVAVLGSETRWVITKSKDTSYTNKDDVKVVRTEPGAMEDYTAANVEKRGVIPYTDDVPPPYSAVAAVPTAF